MTVDYRTRDPFFDTRDPEPDAESAAVRWTAAMKIANGISPKLPGIMIDMAGGKTQEEAAKRAGVSQATVSGMIKKLRLNQHRLKPCDLN